MRTITVTQHRDPMPDYSDEEDRYEMAKMLLQEAELDSTDPVEQVIEASWAAGFNGFDDACLRLLAEFLGLFPIDWAQDQQGKITVQFGTALDAINSNADNVNFWENGYLRDEAARREPNRWRVHEAELARQFHQHLT
ncbi:hypothetical protein PXK01_15335 [Phaeobacter sp. PT47_59]|uniref:hypothetical protein n=1 Tax=Phaeobacter sp. PT47_59 TaxID=3029979 RepID=UPI00237FF47E|nr:hypothetical protein [Phaeobacter sp. PT47_59]MDE4175534.1 hypothetical protein [Phaeobacter sp. PT47_59]